MFKSFLKIFSLEILPEIPNQYFLIFKNKNNMWQQNIFLKIWKIYSIFKNRKEKIGFLKTWKI